MKKLVSWMLAIMLAVLSMPAIAETIPADGEEELLDQYVSELKDSDEFFSIPIRFGIIYSVALYRNGVGIVFQPVTNKAASLG